MSGIITWFIFAREAFLRPDTFFKELEVHGYTIPFAFSLLSISIASYLGAIAQVVRYPVLVNAPSDLLFLLIFATVVGLIGGTILVGLWSAVTHAFVDLLGGTDLQNTVVATTYATAVIGFLGWLSVLGLILSPYLSYGIILVLLAYTLYVQAFGLHHRHGLSMKNAVIGSVLPAVTILGGIAALYLLEPALAEQLLVIPERIALHIYFLFI